MEVDTGVDTEVDMEVCISDNFQLWEQAMNEFLAKEIL